MHINLLMCILSANRIFTAQNNGIMYIYDTLVYQKLRRCCSPAAVQSQSNNVGSDDVTV